MNLFEHARNLYRLRHQARRQAATCGLRSVESMCDRRGARPRMSTKPLRRVSGPQAHRSPRAFLVHRTTR